MLYVTDDGGNYAPIDRCKIVDLTDAQNAELESGAEMHQLDPEPEDLLAGVKVEIKKALEGASNDAEHDALFSVAELLQIDYKPSED